jgi:hypothetical protein
MNLVSLLVALILIGLAFWAVRAIGGAFNIPAPVITVITVILVILVVLWLLGALGLSTGGPRLEFS